MSEGKWPHLYNILLSTDNHDSLPSNRPLHVYMFYRNYLNNIYVINYGKMQLYQVGENGNIFLNKMNFKTEVQSIFTDLPILKKEIPALISSNTIQADVPDPTIQIHHCEHRCRPQGYTNEQCSKGFPQSLSDYTYCTLITSVSYTIVPKKKTE